MTIERPGAVTLRGNPLTLVGPEIKVGDKAPDFTVLTTDLTPFQFSSTRGKVRIISSVPSLDTPVCDAQTRRFNEEAAKLPGVEILTISMDLPFAQKRWCGAAGIDRVACYSDYRDASFGLAYGTLIKELRLDTRAVFVVDADDTVRYVEYVPEIANHPNYEAVLEAARKLIGS
ncbi:MAG: thiol peroxidase [Blastocatellia bacterium]|nr:thiol peroxidase [Blastocatellia bacterium]MCS7156971.1 thiol peroxidase [Blastocatellia bacterium]MCX7752172.1 thiol peroxidase [Blastocatellia bacterium]MDW8167664.1 thiol peroxidase [Acidobacteriota bacterium]MDW8256263.1 thiol peroxidase [Acidobacteriota bacterium]